MTDKSSTGTNPGSGNNAAKNSAESGSSTQDFYSAVAQLEASLQDLVGQKKEETLRQATAFIKDASTRISDQIGPLDDDESAQGSPRRSRRRGRSKQRMFKLQPGSDHLYRGPNSKIGGVCSGFARYFGVEAWVMRLAAITGLIFIPTLVLPAYVVAYFVMNTAPQGGSQRKRHRYDKSFRASKRLRRTNPASDSDRSTGVDDQFAHGAKQTSDYVSEGNATWAPRRMLTHSRADFAQAELRLRRIESFITSDQYELQKELKKMEQ
jgi:phage shock protein C